MENATEERKTVVAYNDTEQNLVLAPGAASHNCCLVFLAQSPTNEPNMQDDGNTGDLLVLIINDLPYAVPACALSCLFQSHFSGPHGRFYGDGGLGMGRSRRGESKSQLFP